MAYLTPDEIGTHLYGEVTTEVSRGDASLLQTALNAAIAEAKGYLTAYDTATIYAETGDDRNPILLMYTKDIAVWHYLQLANPAVDMALRLTRYEKAVQWLQKVQSGKTNPDLPYVTVVDPEVPMNYMKYGSICKRNNNF